MANAKMSRPKLDENGDPIFELNNYVLLPDLPPNLHESLIEEYTHVQHTLHLLRDLWFVQLVNPDHRNYWNIRAAYDFWTEHGPERFKGVRKLGWWFEGEGEGEDEGGSGIRGGNWITWGIERLEGELMDMVIKNGRRFRRVRRKRGSEKLRSEQTVKIVEADEDDGVEVGEDAERMSLGSMKDIFPEAPPSSGRGSVLPGSPISVRRHGDAEMLSLGSMKDMFPEAPPSSDRGSVLPGSPISACSDGGVGGYTPSEQMANINQETNESLAEYLRARDLDADGDCRIIESIEPNPEDDVFMTNQESILGPENLNNTPAFQPNIDPALRSRALPRHPNHKRELSQDSDSDGGILIKDPAEGTYGPVRKSPKRSAGPGAGATKGGEAVDVTCISSRSSSGTIQGGEEEIIEI